MKPLGIKLLHVLLALVLVVGGLPGGMASFADHGDADPSVETLADDHDHSASDGDCHGGSDEASPTDSELSQICCGDGASCQHGNCSPVCGGPVPAVPAAAATDFSSRHCMTLPVASVALPSSFTSELLRPPQA